MDKEFDTELDEVLKKHMHQKMYEVLKERIEERDGLQADLKSANEHISKLEDANEKLKKTLSKHDELDNREAEQNSEMAELDMKIANIEKRERDMVVTCLRLELQCANDKALFAKDMALGLVRNTTFKESVLRDKVVHYDENKKDDYGAE
jgi:DNA repair exonuclease SbcCD ATPase subunit